MPPPATPKFNPLETIALQSPTSPASVEFSPKVGPSVDPDAPVKRWYHYIPLCAAILLILAPHPSWLFVLISYHYTTLHRPLLVVTHLLITYALTFMIYSSLIVCVARDPGPVTFVEDDEASTSKDGADGDGGAEPLMPHEDYSLPGRWCRKCWGPKPERTHHCSICGRCVLKMDHHCPWMGAKCIGHRTYPAFLHFLLCVTLLGTYIAVVCIFAVWDAFTDPSIVNELTPLHALFLTFYALVFALVIGSFYFYHLYLVCTNQTTIENLSPFLLLRHLPPLPPGGQGLSNPPLEQELSRAQRNLVKEAQGWIRLYDVGWRRNAGEVFGWRGRWGWVLWVWCGGKGWVFFPSFFYSSLSPFLMVGWFGSVGDGRVFPRNPKSEELLQRLATELVKVEVEDRRR